MLRLTLFALLYASLLQLSLACFACGICSSGGCNVPPPPPPTCGGCGRGYACGSYGCYRMRARARSSLTLNIEKEKEKELELINLSPNEKFMACCSERNLPDSCLPKCSYKTYTKQALQSMYFKMDSCPMQAAADIHFCAAQGRDHRDCCYRNGVAGTLAGPKCLTFCDQRPGNITQLDMSYLACYDRFDSMKGCFYHDMTEGEGANLPPISVPAQEGLSESERERKSEERVRVAEMRESNAQFLPTFDLLASTRGLAQSLLG